MSNELLKDIGRILDYHRAEFRALSFPAQHDLGVIQKGIRDAIEPRQNNGADGLQQPVKPTKLRARAKLKGKKKTK